MNTPQGWDYAGQVTGWSSKATTNPGGLEMGHDDTKALKGHHASFQSLKVRVIWGSGFSRGAASEGE